MIWTGSTVIFMFFVCGKVDKAGTVTGPVRAWALAPSGFVVLSYQALDLHSVALQLYQPKLGEEGNAYETLGCFGKAFHCGFYSCFSPQRHKVKYHFHLL